MVPVGFPPELTTFSQGGVTEPCFLLCHRAATLRPFAEFMRNYFFISKKNHSPNRG